MTAVLIQLRPGALRVEDRTQGQRRRPVHSSIDRRRLRCSRCGRPRQGHVLLCPGCVEALGHEIEVAA